MSPYHLFVGEIDLVVVGVVYLLANLDNSDPIPKHFLDDVHDVPDLHLYNEDEAPAVTRLKIRPVQREKVGEVRHNSSQIGLGVVFFPLPCQ